MTCPNESPLFTPLDPSKKEIRLLQIAPYDDNVFSICECTMTKASLLGDPPPKFNAFSYEWNYKIDVPEIGTTVMVNGHRVEVTKNLAALLTRYRDIRRCIPDSEWFQVPLWIDALCIDSANNEERSSQVALMGAIYSSAEATLTWLGESENDSDYAMETIGSVAGGILQSLGGDIMSWVDPEKQSELWQREPGREEFGGLNRFWTAVGGLVKRSYWKRAWIVQEILLQLNVIIFCGKTITHYHALNGLYYWLRSIRGKPCPPGVDVELWIYLSTTLGWTSMGWNNFHSRGFKSAVGRATTALDDKERHLRWKTWAVKTISQQATDPRDHLYSVLGLVGDDVLRPDYSLSAEVVFQNFAATNIRVEGNLAILTHAGHWETPPSEDLENKGPPTMLFVPSWAPNWDQTSKMFNFTWTVSDSYEADKGWQSVFGDMDQGVPWSIEGAALVTPGVLFDVITQSKNCEVMDGSWLSFCVDLLKSQSEQLYPPGIPVMQALARLALRGRSFPAREPLDPSADLATIVEKIYPGFLATLGPTKSTGSHPSFKAALENLGVPTQQALIEKLVGKPWGDLLPDLVGLRSRMRQFAGELQFPTTADDPWPSLHPSAADFSKDLVAGMQQHTAFVTAKGYVGWGRKGFRIGDCVCVLPGCLMPVLLRKVDSQSIHLGTCYVEGLMHGEAISCVKKGTAHAEIFHIV